MWSDVTNGRLVVDAAKTRRTRVSLLPVVRKELAELQLRQVGQGGGTDRRTAHGEAWSESLFRSFRRHRWSKLAPGMCPYDLRHAYVSLIQAGHTVVEVAKWAGHSPQVCLGTYAICSTRLASGSIRTSRFARRATVLTRTSSGPPDEDRVHPVCTIPDWYDEWPRATQQRKA